MTTLENTITKHYTQTGMRVTKTIDEYPSNPREFNDNLTTMICHCRNYSLGDVKESEQFEGFTSLKELKQALVEYYGEMAYIKPLSLYDHSTQTLAIGEPTDMWDSGDVGFIFVTKEQARKEYGVKRITKSVIEKIEKLAQSEVEEYNKVWLWGEVYVLSLERVFTNIDDKNDSFVEPVDSVGGFTFGNDYTVEEAIGECFGLKQGEYELVEK